MKKTPMKPPVKKLKMVAGIGARLETLRASQNLTVQEFCSAVPISYDTWYGLAKDILPRELVLTRIISRFNINRKWLIDGEDAPMILELPKKSSEIRDVSLPWRDEAYLQAKKGEATWKEKYEEILRRYDQVWKRLEIYMDMQSHQNFQPAMNKSGSEAKLIYMNFSNGLFRKVAQK